MLQQTSPAAAAVDDTAPSLCSAAAAARLAEALVGGAAGDAILYLAADETRAATIAAIAAALLPDTAVVHVPASDALPGDEAPASPANVGQRVAALRRVRSHEGQLLLIASAEASAVRYPPVEAFDLAPPRLAVGDAIDTDALLAEAEALGYIVDDRVDEPGEIAVRGGVVDLFSRRSHPAGAGGGRRWPDRRRAHL